MIPYGSNEETSVIHTFEEVTFRSIVHPSILAYTYLKINAHTCNSIFGVFSDSQLITEHIIAMPYCSCMLQSNL